MATDSISTHSDPPHTSRLMHYHPMQLYIDLYSKATSPVLSHREGYTGYLSIAPDGTIMSRCPNEKLLQLPGRDTALDERFW